MKNYYPALLLALPICVLICKNIPSDIHMKVNADLANQDTPLIIAQPSDKKIELHKNIPFKEKKAIAPIPQTNKPDTVIQASEERVVIIKNKITKKMITYTKCFVPYTPDFVLKVNGTELKLGEEQSIAIKKNRVTVTFSYNFLNGYKKGTSAVEFDLPESKQECEITFSWKNDWRVIMNDAKPLTITQLN